MRAVLLRVAILIAICQSLCGCIFIKVTSVRVDADLAMPAPPMLPDSIRAGQFFGQMGVRFASAQPVESDSFQWRAPRVGGDIGVQYVASRHVRILSGASVSSTPSAWFGMGTNVRNTYLAWDFDALFGATWTKVNIHGQVTGWEDESDPQRKSSLVDQGSRVLPWMQFAVRTRMRGSGPWLELRVQPGMKLGVLVDPEDAAEDQSVVSITTATGGGWIQEFPNGSALVVGARTVGTQLENVTGGSAQGFASWVQPF